jgi:hypothetical protein
MRLAAAGSLRNFSRSSFDSQTSERIELKLEEEERKIR